MTQVNFDIIPNVENAMTEVINSRKNLLIETILEEIAEYGECKLTWAADHNEWYTKKQNPSKETRLTHDDFLNVMCGFANKGFNMLRDINWEPSGKEIQYHNVTIEGELPKKKFQVQVETTSHATVVVEAHSEEEAKGLALQRYKEGDTSDELYDNEQAHVAETIEM